MTRNGNGIATSTDDIATAPFTVVVDTREQVPFTFLDLRTDAKDGRKPLVVPTVRGTLTSGDYSIHGFESQVSIERKGLDDLFNTLGQGRERFERELIRLASSNVVADVVIEADWGAIVAAPPQHSRLDPKTIFRSVIAWRLRFPNIHWWCCPGRRFAEILTYRLLERFWKDLNRP